MFSTLLLSDGNGGTAEQIYEFVQYQLRKATDDAALKDKLHQAESAINRGAVDAERQLRAGCQTPPPPPDAAGP